MYHLLLLLIATSLCAEPLFQGISLEQFGRALNNNAPLQPSNRFNRNQPLRTNDFQALQQRFASNRQVVRMAQFYISQGVTGPGISLPATQAITQEFITTPIDSGRLLFGCAESPFFNITTNLLTTQALLVTYTLLTPTPLPANPQHNDTSIAPPLPPPPPNFSIVDYNVIGNAFHDLQYTNLTPVISFQGESISRILVDGRPADFFLRLPEGKKFKIETQVTVNGVLVPGNTWLLYVERSPEGIIFLGSNNQLVATRPFTGFIRVAAIQTTPVPASNNVPLPMPVGPFWAEAISQQTKPATPISMYMLWPRQWVQLVIPQILAQLRAGNHPPQNSLLADLLPVLAKLDFPAANTLFRQIPFNDYGDSNNPFLTFFMMLVSSSQALEIDNYQANAFPVPQTTHPNAQGQENAFDQSRSVIPITAEVDFTEEGHTWRYLCLDALTNPLIIYPSYKTLRSPLTPVPGFAHLDPIKGPLQAVLAYGNRVSFIAPPLPTFFQTSFFPTTLNLTSSEKNFLLQIYRDPSVQNQRITASNIADAGPQLYAIALTAQVGAYLFEQSGYPPASVVSATATLINRVKTALAAVLFFRVAADNFIGDSLTGGIVTTRGVGTTTARGALAADDNNGLYSNHDTQYGLWLASAAVVAEWDRKYGQINPLFRQTLIPGVVAKTFIDVLWRDSRNPDKEDPIFPFNRHGNPWEAHSTASGSLYTPLREGREQANWALDFHSWMATREWARAVQLDSGFLSGETQGFDRLQTFAESNMGMTVTSTPLIYQNKNWIYPSPYDVNITLGKVFDTATDSNTGAILDSTGQERNFSL